jgi:trk system potassium uptake protein TrkH
MARTRKINFDIILRVLGILLIIEGSFMATALGFSAYYGGKEAFVWSFVDGLHEFWSIAISALFTLLVGLLLYIIPHKEASKVIGKREGYIIVSTAWVVISLFGALPFVVSGCIPSYTDAFFETISGFTTTGATILTDVEAMPEGLLFWRSTTHWIGGMGIIVLSLAILPFLGIGGMQLFIAEVPGPTPDRLRPRITQTAKRLWGIYVLLTVVETLLLMLGGMNFFDGICHAFGTMATGGFSTRNTSVAGFSPYIQYVIAIFMILAGTNFTLHYLALHGRIREIWRNEEFRYYIYTILLVSSIITIALVWSNLGSGVEQAFRDSIFTVSSIITTTGFITVDYLKWPGALWFLIFMLMFVGGSAGSTAGSIKVVRQLLLFKNSLLELKRLMHPQAVIPVRMNGRPVSQDIIFNVLAFFLIYIIIFAIGTFVMSLLGLDFETAIGSAATTLGNVGPGLGAVGPVGNFSMIPDIGKWFLSFLMLLGRLELFTVLILFSPVFWKR